MPPAPPYEAAEEREATWLRGSVRKERYIELLYNCQPEGGVTELDVMIRDAVPGLGPFEVQLESDCVSLTPIALKRRSFRLTRSGLSAVCLPASSAFLRQGRTSPSSPSASASSRHTQSCHLATIQLRPSQMSLRRPIRYSPLAHGQLRETRTQGCARRHCGGAWTRREQGRGRSSSKLTGEIRQTRWRGPARYQSGSSPLASPCSVLNCSVPTPIQVTHKLAIEVLFSVWAEDEAGQTLPMGGPGAVRALMIKKNTVVASVSCSVYDSLISSDLSAHSHRKSFDSRLVSPPCLHLPSWLAAAPAPGHVAES